MFSTHAAVIGLIAGLGSAELLLILLGLGWFAFWIWMIVDCANSERDSGNKVVWMLVILLVGLVGAPLYFFVRKLSRKSA